MDYMTRTRSVEVDEHGLQLLPAGMVVPRGTYLREDRPWAPALTLDHSAVLPASLDGHRVRYIGLTDAPVRP